MKEIRCAASQCTKTVIDDAPSFNRSGYRTSTRRWLCEVGETGDCIMANILPDLDSSYHNDDWIHRKEPTMRTKKPTIEVVRFHLWKLVDKYRGDTRRVIERLTDPVHGQVADMLRYDGAFINPAYPEIVITVRAKFRGRGLHPGAVTHGRWDSFGFRIGEHRDEALTDSVITRDADQWFTFRHARTTDGAMDYTRLARITLREWMTSEGD